MKLYTVLVTKTYHLLVAADTATDAEMFAASGIKTGNQGGRIIFRKTEVTAKLGGLFSNEEV